MSYRSVSAIVPYGAVYLTNNIGGYRQVILLINRLGMFYTLYRVYYIKRKILSMQSNIEGRYGFH